MLSWFWPLLYSWDSNVNGLSSQCYDIGAFPGSDFYISFLVYWASNLLIVPYN